MRTILDELLTLEDPMGVVTVQAGFDPADRADVATTPARVRKLLDAVVDDADGAEQAAAVERRVREMGPRIDDVLDPRTSGRGRYLAFGVADGEVREERLQVPLPDDVVLDAGPTLRGLLEVLDEHAPAGVVLLHAEEALVLHLELGETEPVVSLAADLGDRVFGDEFYGPSTGAPSSLRRGLTNRERRADRVQANLDRFLDDVAGEVTEAAADLGWDRVVLVGPTHERDVVAGGLRDGQGPSVLHLDRVAASGPRAELVEAVTRVLQDDHRATEIALVRSALDHAAADGAGAVGPVDVARALTRGRVHHLLLTGTLDVAGSIGRDGVLVAADDDEASASDLQPVDRFVHRMIERALATDARVTPVDGEAAALLHEQGEVAALLRW